MNCYGGYKVVIYDCDGVMFNSLEANSTFYEAVMRHMGVGFDRTDAAMMRIIHTFANREVLAHFFPEPERFAESVRFAGTIDYKKLIPLMIIEEGFVATLKKLKPLVNLAVCTNRSTSMDAVLEGFELTGYFNFVMTAARSTYPKPHPEPLNRVLAHYGIRPDEALFVGDSAVDCQSAAAAKVPFVAYKADLPCFARIDRHEEIIELLEVNP